VNARISNEGQHMSTEKERFHHLYGAKRQRINLQARDALDYSLMIGICAAVLYFAYGAGSALGIAGLALCGFMIAAFPMRHGFELRVPLILSRPQDVVYSLAYKLRNIKWPYFAALALLLLENYVISVTPQWPHHVEWMRGAALYLFYGHLALLTLYRTVILAAHLRQKRHVREVLMQTPWRHHLEKQPSVTLEIVHAYCTGLLTHLVILVPWYLVITHLRFSAVLLPVTLLAGIVVQIGFVKIINEWFYRDHWVSHNSELDFVYLHGSHHDAIPSGLIGVAGNGYLEGLLRGTLAFPTPFVSPFVAAIYYTMEVKGDIDLHQYIPGVFPKLRKDFYEVGQHSVHHFGRLEPYGFGLNLDQPHVSEKIRKQFKIFPLGLKHSIKLDERLTGYKWDNGRYRWFMSLVDRFEHGSAPPAAGGTDSNPAPAPRAGGEVS
jgi:hypothetical protein